MPIIQRNINYYLIYGFIFWLTSGICSAQEVVDGDENESAQDSPPEFMEVLVSIGTRVKNRSVEDSVSPIQYLDQIQIDSVADADDLIDVIQRLIPSFNVSREPISDGSSFIRPPFVRGLDSDKILVLINGKRRHKGALVRPSGSGVHGVDITAIPVSAIKSIELLQDGASALYGSDAIAGVLNINLKDGDEGTEFTTSVGEHTLGGGDILFTGHIGSPLGEGFLNIAAEYSNSDPTSRGKRYDIPVGGGSGLTPEQSALVEVDTDGDGRPDRFGPDSLTEIRNSANELLSLIWGSDGIPDDTTPKFRKNLAIPEQVWGQPSRRDAKLTANFNYPISTEKIGPMDFYGFSTWRTSESTGDFFYRRPGIGQLNPLRLENGAIYNPRDRFPGGFTPRFTGEIDDLAWVLGFRRDFNSRGLWDVSVRRGTSQMQYSLRDTWNPSMGPSSPTQFKPGELESSELSLNLDIHWTWEIGWGENVRIPIFNAFGFEHRRDGYQIRQGDEPSYIAGAFAQIDPFNWDITQAEVDADPNDHLTHPTCLIPGHNEWLATQPETSKQPNGNCIAGDPIYNVMSVGSNGFPGYAPTYTVDESTGRSALYTEFSMTLTDRWIADVAIRAEDAGSYGFVTTWKLAGRFQFTEEFAVRSSLSSGFKSPTIGQESIISVSTRINPEGLPVAEGIFPNTHPVSAYFGAQPLDPERSSQFNVGVVFGHTSGLHATLDIYQIEVTDRLTLSSPFTVDNQAIDDLAARGFDSARSIAQVIFFNNALETRSLGVDWVMSYSFATALGVSHIAGNFNWNKIEITDQIPQQRRDGSTFVFVNAEGLYDFEHTWPKNRMTITFNHSFPRDIQFNIRAHGYGSYSNASNATLTTIQEFNAKWMCDAQVKFPIHDHYEISFSATNIFNARPDTAQFEACCGRIVRSDSLVPWQGPYYSLRFKYRIN